VFFLTISFFVQGQRKIHILDAFYEAISMDSTENLSYHLSDGEFVLDDYKLQKINPKTIIARYPEAKKYLVNDSIFVIKGDLRLTGRIHKVNDFDPSIEISNIEFEYAHINITIFNPSSPNEIFYGSVLTFKNVKAAHLESSGGSNIQFKISNCQIDFLGIALSQKIPSVKITQSILGFVVFAYMTTDNISLVDNKINALNIDNVQAVSLEIKNNTIYHLMLKEYFKWKYLDDELLIQEPFRISAGDKQIHNVQITENQFKTNNGKLSTYIGVNGNNINISKNSFETLLRLDTRTSAKFELYDNDFSDIALMASIPQTPQNFVNINWKDLSEKLVWKHTPFERTYTGKSKNELGDASNYNGLISSYRKIVEVYKNNGNTTDANFAYLEMKDFEQQRFKYVYEKKGGSENYFRLKLHHLLSVYTKHGTDPAQAISASVWLIFLFSIIYFFFPSDWDQKSKPQLTADFKNFVQKNEHGYFIPFLKMSKGLIISMLNAITLSINSFITLGFGTIPTKGLAKYICIIEGFIGWFLLSIFIVALINQVMF